MQRGSPRSAKCLSLAGLEPLTSDRSKRILSGVDRGWERWAALAGVAFVALYVAAFSLGIEVGDSDQAIRDYYASSGHRTKEMVAFSSFPELPFRL
jgi:hypothetical protein